MMMNELGLDLACDIEDDGDDMSDPMAVDTVIPINALGGQNAGIARHLQALERENHRLRRLVISLRIAA